MVPSLAKDEAAGNPGGRTFFGHPRGLATLFMTEMWERFSFYGMRALLVLYLTAKVADGGLQMDKSTAAALVAVYLAAVYLASMPGGWLGDRVWGPRKTVAFSAVIIMVGHALLATGVEVLFFVGLVCILLGSGFLKANISTMVGQLYEGAQDPRRDGGFTVFYMGINVGGFLAPLVVGTVGQLVSWHLGFALAALGMALGLIQFLFGTKHLAAESSVVPNPLSAAERSRAIVSAVVIAAVAVVYFGVLQWAGVLTMDLVLLTMGIVGLIVPTYYFTRMQRDREVTVDEKRKLNAYILFFVAAALFWMIFDQAASTLSLFAEKSIPKDVAGFAYPSSWFQAVNPFFIMALAPVMAALWVKLGSRNPTTTTKFSLGVIGAGVSFTIMAYTAAQAGKGGGGLLAALLILVYLVQTISELCLSPVGLSVTTKLAPAKYASQLMGVWFLAVTAGDCVFAIIQLVVGKGVSSPAGYLTQALVVIAAGVVFLALRKRVQPLMGEVK